MLIRHAAESYHCPSFGALKNWYICTLPNEKLDFIVEQKYVLKDSLAIIGPPAKRSLNGDPLAGR